MRSLCLALTMMEVAVVIARPSIGQASVPKITLWVVIAAVPFGPPGCDGPVSCMIAMHDSGMRAFMLCQQRASHMLACCMAGKFEWHGRMPCHHV